MNQSFVLLLFYSFFVPSRLLMAASIGESPIDVWATTHVVCEGDLQEHALFSRYLCSICHKLLNDPILSCKTAEHLACRACLQTMFDVAGANKVCPICRDPVPRPFVGSALMRRLMGQDIRVKCPLSTYCAWQGTWGPDGADFTTHLTKKCPGRLVPCEHCTHPRPVANMPEHVRTCEWRPVHCLICNETYPALRYHACPEGFLPCPHLDEAGQEHKVKRKEVDAHLDYCPEMKLTCMLCEEATTTRLWLDGEDVIPSHTFRRSAKAQHWAQFASIHGRVAHARLHEELATKKRKEVVKTDDAASKKSKRPSMCDLCIRVLWAPRGGTYTTKKLSVTDLGMTQSMAIYQIIVWNPYDERHYILSLVYPERTSITVRVVHIEQGVVHLKPVNNHSERLKISDHYVEQFAASFIRPNVLFYATRQFEETTWTRDCLEFGTLLRSVPRLSTWPTFEAKHLYICKDRSCDCLWITTSKRPDQFVGVHKMPLFNDVCASCALSTLVTSTILVPDRTSYHMPLKWNEVSNTPFICVSTRMDDVCVVNMNPQAPVEVVDARAHLEGKDFACEGPPGLFFIAKIVNHKLVIHEWAAEEKTCRVSPVNPTSSINGIEEIVNMKWNPVSHHLLCTAIEVGAPCYMSLHIFGWGGSGGNPHTPVLA